MALSMHGWSCVSWLRAAANHALTEESSLTAVSDLLHGMAADLLRSEVANARQRIHRTEVALQRTEEMPAENLALCSRIRNCGRGRRPLSEDRSPQL
ncbi:hypothetical protein [Mesorhizobium sp. M0678]|uniref:hypothetical protein n=1 Tax=Mesorhizobium sp. M0678 TaxID=2956985 RepID=UPI00333D4509